MQRAVEVKPDYMEAMVYYNLLYREKAKLDLDPKKKDVLDHLGRRVARQGDGAAGEEQGRIAGACAHQEAP